MNVFIYCLAKNIPQVLNAWQVQNIGGHSSRWTSFSCKKLSTILSQWGLALSSWKMAFWLNWRRYDTTWGQRISWINHRPFKFPGTTTRAVLPFKLIPVHIITLPPLYAVVGWNVSRFEVSLPTATPLLGFIHPPFADKTWIHQRGGLVTIAVDSIRRVMHKTSTLGPCDVGKAELFSRFSWTEPRSSNSIPDSLHREATCTVSTFSPDWGHPQSVGLLQSLQCIGYHAGL